LRGSEDDSIVSVVVPVIDHRQDVRSTVASARASTVAGTQIIVVNGGPLSLSVPGQLAVECDMALASASTRWPALCNAGVAVAAAPYVVCLGPGTRVDRTYLEKAVWVLERDPSVAFVFPCATLPENEGAVGTGEATRVPDQWRSSEPVMGSVFRKSYWELLGGFDESLDELVAVSDFWLRANDAGGRPFRLQEPLSSVNSPLGAISWPAERSDSRQSVQGQLRLGPTLLATEPRQGGAGRSLRRSKPYRVLATLKWRMAGAYRERAVRRWLRHPGTSFAFRKTRSHEPASETTKWKDRRDFAQTERDEEPCRLNVRDDGRAGVLYIVPWLEVGGADRVNLELLRGLDQTKFRPVLMTTVPSRHPWAEEFKEHVAEIFHVASLPGGAFSQADPREALALISHLAHTRQVALVQVSNSELGYELLPDIRRATSAQVVSLVHGTTPDKRIDHLRMAVGLDRFIDRHVTVSSWLADDMKRRGANAEKIVTITNGVDTDLFRPGHSSFVTEAGLPGNTKVVAFVGRLAEVKGPLLFAQAMKELSRLRSLEDVAVVVAGDGPLRGAMESALLDVGHHCPVVLLGTQNAGQIAALLKSTSVFVAPSKREGTLPMVGLEAMASAVPVVATRVPGWEQDVADGLTGVLVPRDAHAIAEAVDRLLSDEDMSRAIGDRARQEVLARYSLRTMQNAWNDLYRKMLSTG
jgi:glycosyltransferase involved in cell wall biosynthesis